MLPLGGIISEQVPFWFTPVAISVICEKAKKKIINQNKTYGKGYKAKLVLWCGLTVAEVMIVTAKGAWGIRQ